MRILLCLIGAVTSFFRGRRYIHGQDAVAEGALASGLALTGSPEEHRVLEQPSLSATHAQPDQPASNGHRPAQPTHDQRGSQTDPVD